MLIYIYIWQFNDIKDISGKSYFTLTLELNKFRILNFKIYKFALLCGMNHLLRAAYYRLHVYRVAIKSS